MAKTRRAQGRDRQAHPRHRACDEHGLDPELLIFDLAHVHAHHRRRRVEAVGRRDDRGHPPAQGRAARASRPRWASPTCRFGVSPPRPRGAQLRLPPPLRGGRARPGDGQPEPHHALRRDLRRGARARRRPRLQPPRGRARALHRALRVEGRGGGGRGRRPHRRAWSPRRRSTGTSCAARRTGVEDWIDRSVEKIGAVPTLNEVLLPAMKEVGDKFGAGELILPFVLQSAEVMKRAVAQLENYLDKIEGHTKGTVVIATVFGDVHDIGKSLVNTILTNNGYTVVDLGKQVPVDTIIDAAVEHNADRHRPLRAARLHLQADADLRPGAARAGPRVPGARSAAPRSTATSAAGSSTRRARSPTRSTSPASSTARTRSQGLATMDQLVDADARDALVEKIRDEAQSCARSPSARTSAADRRRLRPLARARTDVPDPEPPFWGAREIAGRPRRRLPAPRPPRAVQAPLGRPRREGRGLGAARRREDFQPRLERMWREQDYLHPRARARLLPVQRRRQRARGLRPRGPASGARAARRSRASPSTTASAWPTSTGRSTRASATWCALQAVTVGDEVTELMAKLEERGRVRRAALHRTGSACRPPRASPSGCTPRCAATSASTPTRAAATPGATRPARTSPSTRRSGACWTLEQIGMTLSGGYARRARAVDGGDRRPPPAGRVLRHEVRLRPREQAPDELIAGTERGGAVPADDDPDGDGTIEAEVDQPATESAPA